MQNDREGEVKSGTPGLGNDKLKRRSKWSLKKSEVRMQEKEWWCWFKRALREDGERRTRR